MEDRHPRLSSTTLARVLSVAGHPFLIIPVLVGITTRDPAWTAVVAALTVLPLMVITSRNVRRGSWSDFDVSRREQRSGLYYVAIPLMAAGALVLAAMGADSGLLRGFVAAGAMLLAGILANRWLKVSMHMMCGGFFAVVLVRLHPWSAAAVVPFFAAVAWSRWKLRRHTPAEIAVGTVIGVLAAIVI